MFKRVLIANRGEIARRIARTCRKLGVDFVAVYSTADAGALHLQGAVAAVCLGAGPAADSYLNGAAIIEAALQHDCDAIHPGYGFLSENADFAVAVEAAGLVFIGPRADTIAALGDKSRAKQLMSDAGVPTVPGLIEANDDPARVEEMIRIVGLPVLLKPSAGGGGKGMHVVTTLEGLRETAQAAIRVARNSFGDGRLLVERLVERPRHIEVQVFGDCHGNVVHLFERECSLQRRHQKVVEEAPAINLPEDVRQRLLQSAVRGAQSIGYRNAGTFEFIVGEDHSFYFLEVNTRLQVEHPVTEEITGLDLVEWQLRVAAGEALPLAQHQITATGCAIECRIYAEDPSNGFRPAPGIVAQAVWPNDVRVEAGIASGGEVPPYYDPMVAKLVAHAANRAEALDRMKGALARTFLLGLTTNLGFLSRVLDDPQVRAGMVHTRYLDDALATLAVQQGIEAAVACAAAAAMKPSAVSTWPWAASCSTGMLDRTHLSSAAPLGHLRFWAGDTVIGASLRPQRDAGLRITVSDQVFDVSIAARRDDVCTGTVNGLAWAATESRGWIELQVGGVHFALQALRARTAGEAVRAGAAVAPLPGVVALLPVAVGDAVEPGMVLAIVEAMKMENRVVADVAGVVTAIAFAVGDNVKAGDLLVEVGPAQSAE
jgi:acetyl/propionyl-CoA carboxylase alpha subunit